MPMLMRVKLPPAFYRLVNTNPQEFTDAVIQGWVQQAQQLKDIEMFNVEKRVRERAMTTYPERSTGALASSVRGRVGGGKPTLISVWFDPGPQRQAWNRVYAPYAEGPPAGLSTYTNPPRHLLFDAQTDDRGQIETWAQQAGTSGVQVWVSQFQGG